MKLVNCNECGSPTPISSVNNLGHCEECSMICELCAKPYYQCKDYDYDTKVCGPCLKEEKNKEKNNANR